MKGITETKSFRLAITAALLLLSVGASAEAASTYLGGEGMDRVTAMTKDFSGNIYATGFTYATNFPGTAGGAQTAQGGSGDCFVAKLNSSLSVVQATYLGGSAFDRCNNIALDASGNIYVAGDTNSTNLPGTTGGAKSTAPGGGNGFVAKLNSSLTALSQSTYLGGTSGDYASALAIDGAGNVYVAGTTSSVDFPGTGGGAQSTKTGGASFISMLNPALTAVTQSTFYCGDRSFDSVIISDLKLHGGSVYAAGDTNAVNIPGLTGGAQTVNGGLSDAFAAKLSASLTAVEQATFLGGTGDDYVSAMAVDASGNIYLSGRTISTDLPNVAGGAQTSHGGGYEDAFVVKLGGLTGVAQATYLGGSDSDIARAMAGQTRSTNFPSTAGGRQATIGGGLDGFISRLASDLKTVTQSTYDGGTGNSAFWAFTIGSVIAGGADTGGPGGGGSSPPACCLKTGRSASLTTT